MLCIFYSCLTNIDAQATQEVETQKQKKNKKNKKKTDMLITNAVNIQRICGKYRFFVAKTKTKQKLDSHNS